MEKIVRNLLSFLTGLALGILLINLGYHPEDWQFWAVLFSGGTLLGFVVTKLLHR